MRALAPIALLVAASVALGACSSGGGEKVVTIGAAVSQTGRYAEEGEHTRRGYVTWEEWVNGEQGGIEIGGDQYRVELIIYDDGSDPDRAAELTERLIEEDRVDFLLGPYSSALVARAIAVAEERGMLLVGGSGASETLFAQSYQNLFAVLTPAGSYTQSALKALAERGAESIAIAHSDAIFPESVAEGARRWADEYGLRVLGVETYAQDVTDVSGIVSKFRELSPDVFVGGGYFNDALLFVQTAKALGFSPKAMVLTVGPTHPEFRRELGPDANYLMGPTQWEASMSYRDEYFGSASDYAETFAKRWGGDPAYQSASATAAALALQLAIEEAGSLDIGDVREALRGMDVATFYGQIRFDETGKNAAKPMGTIQIQEGDVRVVAPASSAVADLVYPVPRWDER